MTEDKLVELLKNRLIIKLSREYKFAPYRKGIQVELIWSTQEQDIQIYESFLEDEE